MAHAGGWVPHCRRISHVHQDRISPTQTHRSHPSHIHNGRLGVLAGNDRHKRLMSLRRNGRPGTCPSFEDTSTCSFPGRPSAFPPLLSFRPLLSFHPPTTPFPCEKPNWRLFASSLTKTSTVRESNPQASSWVPPSNATGLDSRLENPPGFRPRNSFLAYCFLSPVQRKYIIFSPSDPRRAFSKRKDL